MKQQNNKVKYRLEENTENGMINEAPFHLEDITPFSLNRIAESIDLLNSVECIIF